MSRYVGIILYQIKIKKHLPLKATLQIYHLL